MKQTEDGATMGSPGSLEIPRSALAALERHAAAAFPEECCGFLVGRPGAKTEGVRVHEALPTDNEQPEDRHRRFLIRPETVLEAMRRARGRGLELVGYYHSHPDHPAEPSPTDREGAWPGVSYVIVPVSSGRAGAARSWRLAADRSGFVEEPMRAVR
jgi:proteasome lid subunit RPN8/RPN11